MGAGEDGAVTGETAVAGVRRKVDWDSWSIAVERIVPVEDE